MVMARLHIICGNCGCNDDFEYTSDYERDDDGEIETRVRIICNNCATIHALEDYATLRE